jgi:hypothetical protein
VEIETGSPENCDLHARETQHHSLFSTLRAEQSPNIPGSRSERGPEAAGAHAASTSALGRRFCNLSGSDEHEVEQLDAVDGTSLDFPSPIPYSNEDFPIKGPSRRPQTQPTYVSQKGAAYGEGRAPAGDSNLHALRGATNSGKKLPGALLGRSMSEKQVWEPEPNFHRNKLAKRYRGDHGDASRRQNFQHMSGERLEEQGHEVQTSLSVGDRRRYLDLSAMAQLGHKLSASARAKRNEARDRAQRLSSEILAGDLMLEG